MRIHALSALFDNIVKLSTELEKKPRRFGTDVYLSSSECHTVELIGEREGLSVTELAKILHVTKGAVSQTLKKLEAKGLIEKGEDPKNLSRANLYLTHKGKIAYHSHKHWHETMDGGFKQFFENLDAGQVDFLTTVLNQVQDFLQKRLQTED